MSRASDAIATAVAQAEAVLDLATPAGRRAARNLARLLAEADQLLADRLAVEVTHHGGPEARFTGASIVSYQTQVRFTLRYVEARLAGLTHDSAMAAVASAATHSVATLARLEAAYMGVSAQAPRVRLAMMLDETQGMGASLLRQHQTSVERYGQAMLREFEKRIQLGFAAGLTQTQMVEMLTGHGGPTGEVSLRAKLENGQVVVTSSEDIPEGLFRRYRYWAERIVRTETARAYNGANLEAYRQMRDDFPDLQKKILAHFDNRTALDSVYVHGQVRPLDGLFRDGAGREYQHPPARPNDRETVIPWRDGVYPEEVDTRPLTPAEIQREDARIKAGRGAKRPTTRRPARPTPARVRG